MLIISSREGVDGNGNVDVHVIVDVDGGEDVIGNGVVGRGGQGPINGC